MSQLFLNSQQNPKRVLLYGQNTRVKIKTAHSLRQERLKDYHINESHKSPLSIFQKFR